MRLNVIGTTIYREMSKSVMKKNFANLNDFDVSIVPKVSVMSLVVAKQQFRTVCRDVLYRDDYGSLFVQLFVRKSHLTL